MRSLAFFGPDHEQESVYLLVDIIDNLPPQYDTDELVDTMLDTYEEAGILAAMVMVYHIITHN